ncbi:MAG: response regulator [Balneolales bacterium]|nr:response regulator [Balneolales bacterium]
MKKALRSLKKSKEKVAYKGICFRYSENEKTTFESQNAEIYIGHEFTNHGKADQSRHSKDPLKISKSHWLHLSNRIHPEDRNRVFSILEEHFTTEQSLSDLQYRIYDTDTGRYTWRNESVFSEKSNNKLLTAVSSHCITHIKKTTKEFQQSTAALRKRERLLNATASVASLLLSETSFNEAVNRSLELIGKAAEADRTYIFKNETNPLDLTKVYTSLRYNWSRKNENTERRKHILHKVEISSIQGFKSFSKGEAFSCSVSELEPEHIIRKIAERVNTSSVLLFPILLKEHLWGMVGFDVCEGDRVWDASDMASLRNFASNIGSAISRYKLEKSLKKEKEKADLNNRFKTQFLANMSHEIRTPLSGIIGYTELIKSSAISAEQEQYISALAESSRTLLSIVNDVLDMSKIESGKIELHYQLVDLPDLVTKTINFFKQQAGAKGLEIRTQINLKKQQCVWADELRLKQILVNLLSNAIKFTDKGYISLEINELKQLNNGKTLLRFSVIDTGIGIKPENQQKIFQAFMQESGSISLNYGGTGLGLSISGNLLKLMNSRLLLQSEPGIGSTFFFDLQLVMLHGEDHNSEAEPAKDLQTEMSAAQVISSTPLSVFSSSLAKKTRILIVDDSPVIAKLVKILLSKVLPESGTLVCASGEEAVDSCNNESFSLIFMDLKLPGIDGFEATKRIRKIPGYQKIPIIALTASTVEGVKHNCLISGMNDFISKPLPLDRLLEIIRQWIYKEQLNHTANKQTDVYQMQDADEPVDIQHTFSTKKPRSSTMESLQNQPNNHFDKRILIERMGGDESAAEEILGITRSMIDVLYTEFEAAMNTDTEKNIKAAAHKIKGTANSLTFNKLAEMGLELEKMSPFNSEEAQKLGEDIKKEIKYLKTLI